MIVALIQLNHDDYVPELWHGTLLFWAIIVVAVFINTVTSSILLKIEIFTLAVHVVGFSAVLIPVVHLAPDKASAHDVFTQFSNGGAWPSQRLSFFIGLIGNMCAMFGCDSAVQGELHFHTSNHGILTNSYPILHFHTPMGYELVRIP